MWLLSCLSSFWPILLSLSCLIPNPLAANCSRDCSNQMLCTSQQTHWRWAANTFLDKRASNIHTIHNRLMKYQSQITVAGQYYENLFPKTHFFFFFFTVWVWKKEHFSCMLSRNFSVEHPLVRILPLIVMKKEYGRKKVIANAIGKISCSSI